MLVLTFTLVKCFGIGSLPRFGKPLLEVLMLNRNLARFCICKSTARVCGGYRVELVIVAAQEVMG